MRKVQFVLGFGIVLGVVGGTFLAAFGVLYVKPYMDIRTMKLGKCETFYQTLHSSDIVLCYCSEGRSECISTYPCLRVWVNLTTEQGVLYSNVTLYDTPETFHLQADALQCAYHKCNYDHTQNTQAVEHFANNEMRQDGTIFDCYYEPTDMSYVIKFIVSKQTIIHCMLWPSLALALGFIILLVYLNDPSQAQHHFNSLERPWLRQQTRYECIINPGEPNTAATTDASGDQHLVSTQAGQHLVSDPDISSSLPLAQLI